MYTEFPAHYGEAYQGVIKKVRALERPEVRKIPPLDTDLYIGITSYLSSSGINALGLQYFGDFTQISGVSSVPEDMLDALSNVTQEVKKAGMVDALIYQPIAERLFENRFRNPEEALFAILYARAIASTRVLHMAELEEQAYQARYNEVGELLTQRPNPDLLPLNEAFARSYSPKVILKVFKDYHLVGPNTNRGDIRGDGLNSVLLPHDNLVNNLHDNNQRLKGTTLPQIGLIRSMLEDDAERDDVLGLRETVDYIEGYCTHPENLNRIAILAGKNLLS